MTKFVFEAHAWEDSDWIVTVRPNWEKKWKDVPLGTVLDSRDARRVADWLNTAQNQLRILFINELRDQGRLK